MLREKNLPLSLTPSFPSADTFAQLRVTHSYLMTPFQWNFLFRAAVSGKQAEWWLYRHTAAGSGEQRWHQQIYRAQTVHTNGPNYSSNGAKADLILLDPANTKSSLMLEKTDNFANVSKVAPFDLNVWTETHPIRVQASLAELEIALFGSHICLKF